MRRLTRRGKRHPRRTGNRRPRAGNQHPIENRPRTGAAARHYRPANRLRRSCDDSVLIERPPAPPTSDNRKTETKRPPHQRLPPRPLSNKTASNPSPEKPVKQNDRNRPPPQSTKPPPENRDGTRQTPTGRTGNRQLGAGNQHLIEKPAPHRSGRPALLPGEPSPPQLRKRRSHTKTPAPPTGGNLRTETKRPPLPTAIARPLSPGQNGRQDVCLSDNQQCDGSRRLNQRRRPGNRDGAGLPRRRRGG